MVDGDRVGRPLARHHADEMGDRVLRRAVDAKRGERHHGVDRRGDDDPAAVTLGSHLRGGGTTAEEHAVQVHAHDLIERLAGHVRKLLPVRDAGVGAEDVQPPEPVDGLGHETFAVGRVGRVGVDERRSASSGLDLGDAIGRLALVRDVADDDVGAAVGEGGGDSAADRAIARGARDDRDLALELRGHSDHDP